MPKKLTKRKSATRKPAKMGRPTKFSDRLAFKILELAKAGGTEAQIARAVGISPATFSNWKNTYPDFLEALRASKNVANDLVELALFQRAIGFQHKAAKFFFDSEGGRILTQTYTQRYAPDVGAIKLWLTNRNPKRWKDLQKHEHDVKTNLADEIRKGRERVKNGKAE